MTPEAQRIAIAEACGWVRHPKDKWVVTAPGYPNSVQPLSTIPNYPASLDAMHEAEKTLRPIRLARYHNILRDRIGSYDLCIHATATQRAEAFLKTLGKWNPNL